MGEYDNQGQPQQQYQQQAPPYSQPGYPPQSGPYIPGQAPPQQYGQQPQYGQPVIIQQQPMPQTVVVVGGCPTCRVGHLEDEFTCLGILCCILFFPLGLICLFTMKERRCTNCGATFG